MIKLLVLLLLNTSFSFADNQLTTALNAFEKGQYDAARAEFLNLSLDSKYSFLSYYNLGNIAAKQNKPGEALAYYRKALKFKPRDSALNFNILFVTQQNKIVPPAGSISFFDVIQQEILSKFSFYEVSIVTFFFLLVFVFTFIGYLKKPSGLPLKLIVWSLLLAVCSIATGLKIIDSYIDRATVIVKSDLKSGPNEANAALTEVPEGAEVLIANTSGQWKQVTVPGSLTGWVLDKNLIQTSGGGPW